MRVSGAWSRGSYAGILRLAEGVVLSRKVLLILIACLLVMGCKAKTKEELFTEGMNMMNANNPSGAIVYLKNALEKDQNYFDARYQLARAYAATGKYEQAEKEFQKVLRQNPSSKDIPLELAKVYVLNNNPDKAIEIVQDYMKSYPDDPQAL